jgi:hypothetical protein
VLTQKPLSGKLPIVERDDRGYIALTDGVHRQVVCQIVEDKVILHWKYDGTAVWRDLEEFIAMLTE